jgi:hypothetical protein
MNRRGYFRRSKSGKKVWVRPSGAGSLTHAVSKGPGVSATKRKQMFAELATHSMGGTEFSAKRRMYVQAGGWWPNSPSDWQTPRGRRLKSDIEGARRKYGYSDKTKYPRPSGSPRATWN